MKVSLEKNKGGDESKTNIGLPEGKKGRGKQERMEYLSWRKRGEEESKKRKKMK